MGGGVGGGVGAVSFFKALTGTSVRIMNLFLRLLLFALHSRAHPGEGGPRCLRGRRGEGFGCSVQRGSAPPKPPHPPFPPLHQTVPHRCSHTRPFLISSAVIVYLSLGKQDSSCPNITSDRQAEEFC